ncbi:MAG TPA: energy transducer TonB [Alphaproteobacteria bacterium]|nr:energy transducer TonB [Alphaproteobacteria bacterium]
MDTISWIGVDGLDNPGEWTRRRVAAWGVAALVHIVALAVFFLYVPPEQPVEIADVPVDMVAPPVPPEPPETRNEPVQQIKPVTLRQPPLRPLVRFKDLAPSPAANAPMVLPSLPPSPPEPQPPPPASQAAPPPTYVAKLFNHLARYKRYPRAAQSAREQGVAGLRFTMNREGRVLAYRIERSSGHADLDAEVLSMIQRAQPLPELPADMPDTVEIVIPISFSLR